MSGMKRPAVHKERREDVEDAVAGQNVEHARMAIKRQLLAFAQIQQPGDMIDIGIGQHNGGQGAGAQPVIRPRLQRAIVVDLLAQIG